MIPDNFTGRLYGTTGAGGVSGTGSCSGCGVVFEMDPNGKETVLHAFTGGIGGTEQSFSPNPLRDEAGNIHGTAYAGGDPACECGLIYKITPPSIYHGMPSASVETALYTFKGVADGAYPDQFGGLVEMRKGISMV